MSDQI